MSDLRLLQSGSLAPFCDWPALSVPKVAAGVYTIWDGERLIYVGMAGRKLTQDGIARARADGGKEDGLRKRLASHSKGQRSGDQFCVYVADRFVLGTLSDAQVHEISAGVLSFDSLVRDYIHRHLSYRWLETADGTAACQMELVVRAGALPAGVPFLNPKGSAV